MNSEIPEEKNFPYEQAIQELSRRLAEAEEILQAISQHKVDAFVIGQPDQEQIYTLKGADHAYQVILETINEGAATVGADCTLYYCNPAFAALLATPFKELIGSSLLKFVVEEDQPICLALLAQGLSTSSKGEMTIQSADGSLVPILLSCSSLKLDGLDVVCMVATDLTEQKRQLEEKAQTERALIEVRRLLTRSQETERLLLARELHDGPLQEMIGMRFNLTLLAQSLTGADQIAKINDLTNSLQKTASQLRLLAQTLRPPVLAHMGLVAAVRAHLKQVQEFMDKPLLTFSSSNEEWELPEETALGLLRIVQQAVQNALQHANAEEINVTLRYENDFLSLEVKDDGCGLKKPYNRIEYARAGHLGIVGMAERSEAIQGYMEITSSPDRGTLIRVTVPRPPTTVDSTAQEKR
jgi:two-component system, NarL family, sensor kinase